MRYDVQTSDGYIISVTTAEQGMETAGNITAAQYAEILAVIRANPQDEDGYGYRLREDLTWERYELPPDKK